MRRRRYGWDERKIAKRRKAGHGQGEGAAYKPWLLVTDVPSKGRSHRLFCEKTGRVHHLLSDNEWLTFLGLWWDDDIIDIREQYPLSRVDTQSIAQRRDVPHPVDNRSRTPLVQTTDFLVTKKDGDGTKLVAIAVKPRAEMSKDRVLELLDLERSYWFLRDVEWRLVLDTEVRNRRSSNLDWIFGRGGKLPASFAARLARCEGELRHAILLAEDVPVRTTCRELDLRLDLEPGTGLGLLRAMLRRKAAIVDLSCDVLQDEPGSAFDWDLERL